MSNPTTPFSWQMPTATDLVTDLPADFEVFGQAVATSMADLLGGTTGQILSKASNTDMDFTWIANDQGDITAVNVTSPITGGGSAGAVTVGIQDASTSQKGSVQLSDSTSTTSSILAATPTAVKSSYDLAAAAIPKSTVTTAGDTIYGTGSGTVTRLGIGSTGQVLTVAAGVPSWATASAGSSNVAGKNALLNSNMSIWQRGTSIACSATAYGADRWQAYRTVAGATVSRQVTGDTTNLPEIQYCQRVQRDSGNTSTTQIFIAQSMETINSIPMVGKTVTISFYARAGANYSSASNALNYRVVFGTGTDQNVITSYTGANNFINQTATLTTTWQRFSYSAAVSTTATELGMYFFNTPVGTAGANDYYEITGVQLEIASSASAYSPNAATFQGELAACQRYFSSSIPEGYTVTDFPVIGTGTPGFVFYATGSNDAFGTWQLPVTMRTTPTTKIYSSSNRTSGSVRSATTGTDYTCSGYGFSTGNRKGSIYLSGFGAGVTSGLILTAQWTADAEL